MCARVPHKQTSKANGFQTKPVLAYEWEARDDGESVPEHSKTSPCCFSMNSANSLIMSPCSESEHCGLSVCEAYCTQHLEPHALCHHHHPEGVPSPGQTMEVTTLQCTHLAHKFKLHMPKGQAQTSFHVYSVCLTFCQSRGQSSTPRIC